MLSSVCCHGERRVVTIALEPCRCVDKKDNLETIRDFPCSGAVFGSHEANLAAGPGHGIAHEVVLHAQRAGQHQRSVRVDTVQQVCHGRDGVRHQQTGACRAEEGAGLYTAARERFWSGHWEGHKHCQVCRSHFCCFQMETDNSMSPVVAAKKAKPSDQGSDEVRSRTHQSSPKRILLVRYSACVSRSCCRTGCVCSTVSTTRLRRRVR